LEDERLRGREAAAQVEQHRRHGPDAEALGVRPEALHVLQGQVGRGGEEVAARLPVGDLQVGAEAGELVGERLAQALADRHEHDGRGDRHRDAERGEAGAQRAVAQRGQRQLRGDAAPHWAVNARPTTAPDEPSVPITVSPCVTCTPAALPTWTYTGRSNVNVSPACAVR